MEKMFLLYVVCSDGSYQVCYFKDLNNAIRAFSQRKANSYYVLVQLFDLENKLLDVFVRNKD